MKVTGLHRYYSSHHTALQQKQAYLSVFSSDVCLPEEEEPMLFFGSAPTPSTLSSPLMKPDKNLLCEWRNEYVQHCAKHWGGGIRIWDFSSSLKAWMERKDKPEADTCSSADENQSKHD